MGVVFSACQSAQIGVTLQDSEEKHKLLPDIAVTASIRKQYEADGTVPVGCDKEMLGLRVFLTDQMALRNFGEYARRKNRTELLICWTEFLEFKCISHVNRVYKRSVAQFLVDKYLAETPLVKLAGITMNPDYRHRVLEAVRLADSDVEDLSLKIFNEFHQQCLKTIHDTLYVNFVKTRLFAESIREFKGICSSISPDDFEYFEMLGEGGFGFVVHVRKKSTGVHHAMKIQRKKGLLDVFARSPVHVLYEKNALVRCQHPFIVGLDYAFQTRSLSFLVMDLGTVGNLLDATRALGRLSEVRVRLYAAEIVLALNHIHELGFIYRDLKPSNVILTAAGHIQLVDLGTIVDTGNRLLSVIHTLGRSVNSSGDPNPSTYHQCCANSTNSGCFDASLYGEWGVGSGPGHGESRQIPDQKSSALSSSYNKPAASSSKSTKVLNSENNVSVNSGSEKLATLNSLSADGLASLVFSSSKTLNNTATITSPNVVNSVSYNFGRAKTVVGTAGYMAPEVLAMSIRDGPSMGYTKAVDYWSLGVTLFTLLHGTPPFQQSHIQGHVDAVANSTDEHFIEVYQSEFKKFRNAILQKSSCSPLAQELLFQLLVVVDEDRLGYGPHGFENIRCHPFFQELDFAKVLLKQVEPPGMPESIDGDDKMLDQKPLFEHFNGMMAHLSSEAWLVEALPTIDGEDPFSHW